MYQQKQALTLKPNQCNNTRNITHSFAGDDMEAI